MVEMQNIKIVNAVVPVSLNNAAATPVTIDTLGWSFCTIFAVVGATTGALSVLKVQHSSDDSSYADLTGSTPTTLPGATDDNKIWCVWHLPIGRTTPTNTTAIKRYLKVQMTENNTGTGIYGAYAILSKGDQGPSSAAEAGATYVINL